MRAAVAVATGSVVLFAGEAPTMAQIKQLWVQVFAWVAPVDKCAHQPRQ